MVLMLIWASISWAQLDYRQRFDISVSDRNGSVMPMPWVGGLNSPQINTMDLNGDGKADLVLFDRMANKFFTFLKTATGHNYEPKYEGQFPEGLTNWVLLRDFNGDGRKDIFTSHPFGIQVFVNIGTNPLTWRPFNNGDALFTIGFNQPLNLKVNVTDIPVIDDLDDDGDLDILNMEFASSSTIEFHQNMNVELTGNYDSLQMKLITQRWGDLTFCGCNSFVFGNTSCPIGGRVQHTGGKALLTAAVGINGVKDLFFSDESCNVVYRFSNTGTNANPEYQAPTVFGNIDAHVFPAAFYEDVDADGARDITISANASHREEAEADFAKSIFFFKSTQGLFVQDEAPLLQSDMIDVGDAAVPAFFDEDGDGDLDMFVGYYSQTVEDGHSDHHHSIGSIAFFRNTGTIKNPIFAWISNDYNAISGHNLVNLKPQFADVNHDGKRDLVFTAKEIETGHTKLFYQTNRSVTGLDLNPAINTIDFDFVGDENLTLTDFDRDGYPDILCGRYDGSIQLWKNSGSNDQFLLTSILDYLGQGSLRIAPFSSVTDLNADGKEDLLIGDQTGLLKIVPDYLAGVNVPADVNLQSYLDDHVLESRKLNGRIYPVPANLRFTNQPCIIVGTQTGGLLHLESIAGVALSIKELFQIYPNPVSQRGFVTVDARQEGTIMIFNMLGQPIGGPILFSSGVTQFTPPALPRGLYLLKVFILGNILTIRLVIE
jgi:hypothetical protein